jgi:hypothetical protein
MKVTAKKLRLSTPAQYKKYRRLKAEVEALMGTGVTDDFDYRDALNGLGSGDNAEIEKQIKALRKALKSEESKL